MDNQEKRKVRDFFLVFDSLTVREMSPLYDIIKVKYFQAKDGLVVEQKMKLYEVDEE